MADAPSDKRIFIIAGPNGAGKTTFAKGFLPGEMHATNTEFAFLNADEIAAELCPEAPETVAVRAGRMMLAQIAECISEGQSFAIETTLSGRAYARAIPRWRAAGYHVSLFFLRLPDAETAIARVGNRVRQGGHHIPEVAIRRRFEAGWRLFNELYKPLVNCWAVYDNMKSPPLLLEKGDRA